MNKYEQIAKDIWYEYETSIDEENIVRETYYKKIGEKFVKHGLEVLTPSNQNMQKIEWDEGKKTLIQDFNKNGELIKETMINDKQIIISNYKNNIKHGVEEIWNRQTNKIEKTNYWTEGLNQFEIQTNNNLDNNQKNNIENWNTVKDLNIDSDNKLSITKTNLDYEVDLLFEVYTRPLENNNMQYAGSYINIYEHNLETEEWVEKDVIGIDDTEIFSIEDIKKDFISGVNDFLNELNLEWASVNYEEKEEKTKSLKI